MSRRLAALLVAVCATSNQLWLGSTVAHASQPFGVKDSIALRSILTHEGGSFPLPGDAIASYSPNGERFLVRAMRGDVERDQIVEDLLFFDTRAVDAFLASSQPKEPVVPAVTAEYRYSDDSDQIANARWLSDHELGYLGRDSGNCRQAFVRDVDSGRVTRLTDAPTDVLSFGTAAGTVLYYARQPVAQEEKLVRPVAGRSLMRLLDQRRDLEGRPVDLFASRGADRPAQRLSVQSVLLVKDNIWMSPDGNQAILLLPAVDAPAHWSEYGVWDNENRGWTPNWVSSDPTSYDLIDRHRYAVVDLRSGTVRSLFDAPDGNLSFSRTPDAVFWLDEHRIVVAHTYLPLRERGLSSDERQRRAQAPAIAEVDIRTGKAQAIAWETFATRSDWEAGRRVEEIVAVDWSPATQRVTLTRNSPDGTMSLRAYARVAGRWTDARAAARTLPIIERRETATERPKLHATGGGCKCTRMLFDPAPEADKFSFGRQETIEWRDSKGNQWIGGLIYPVGYVEGIRYPFILQTHGYMKQEFVIDGPEAATTAFAAQAFANSGFVVLQAADNRAAVTVDQEEGRNVADGWMSAIKKLEGMGLIDPKKIGVIGFSRTGFHLAAMLAEYPDAVAAATIADAVQHNYSQYLLGTNFEFQLATSEFERMTGGLPNEVGYGTWFERHPFYRMARSSAPVRVEAIGEGSLLSLWETYAVRVRQGKPADLVYFPNGSHVLRKPSERLASQGGNVDWFRFWLQGYEDPDSNKAAQYLRWRQLRGLRH